MCNWVLLVNDIFFNKITDEVELKFFFNLKRSGTACSKFFKAFLNVK
jgi:hypothetical protein